MNQLINEVMNDEAVSRTAPATLGVLNMHKVNRRLTPLPLFPEWAPRLIHSISCNDHVSGCNLLCQPSSAQGCKVFRGFHKNAVLANIA